MSPQPPPRSRSFCCSLQVSCVSGTPDQISNDKVPIPRLHDTFPPQPSAHAAASLPADRADEVPIPRSHTVLLWFCVMAMLKFLSRALVFLAFPPPPPLLLFALNLPCRLAAVADALLGMINFDLLFLLLSPPCYPDHSRCRRHASPAAVLLCIACILHRR
jgi:hypothetical protein